MNSIMKKAGVAAIATGAIFSTVLMPSAHAGTGGTNTNGIAYGQAGLYCDGSLNAIQNNDSSNGQPLANAAFTVAAPNADVALKAYTAADVAAGLPAQDKANWILAFNKAADNAWTNSAFGATYKAASMQLSGGAQSGIADGQGTSYTPSEVVTYPADITALQDPTAQSAAMTNWVTMAAASDGSTVTVSQFFTNLKARLDAEGAALYTNYDPNNPTAANTPATTAIAGTAAEAPALAEYNKALTEFNLLLQTIKDAGYAGVTYTGTTVNFGAVNTAAQNFTNFSADYKNLVAQNNYPFGFTPATYDLVAKVIGNAGVTAVNGLADQAIGVTPGASINLTSDANGGAFYGSFGRDNTVASAPATDCAHLAVGNTETAAPNGYIMDTASTVLSVPTNLDPYAAGASSVGNSLTFTNTLSTVAVSTNGSPVNPQFDSGK